jgi:hypothetical protein
MSLTFHDSALLKILDNHGSVEARGSGGGLVTWRRPDFGSCSSPAFSDLLGERVATLLTAFNTRACSERMVELR